MLWGGDMRILFVFLCFSVGLFGDAKEVVQTLVGEADIQINGKRDWDITVYNEQFYDLVLSEGSMGLGESYMAGWWDAEALDVTMSHILGADLERHVKSSWKMKWEYVKAKLFNRQSRKGSLQVIDQHYQLGNDLYVRMLDGLMTYSCGYWKDAKTLDEAQEAKYDLIARKLRLKEGQRVLDIGCGWGGFAKYVASKYGVEVVGVTLSTNQAEYARVATKGLPVEIRVQDYRDVDEKFDAIVEIGMFEHVGTKNYQTFFDSVHRNLKEGGYLMLHTIGKDRSTTVDDPWIDKYIFPGGHIPSIAQISKCTESLFVMEDWHNFGPDYDKTLMAWKKNFNSTWGEISQNYPPSFYRMWNYYLSSCAGAFRSRTIQLWQVVFSKGGTKGGYQSVR